MQAYGFNVKTMTESECVAELMKMCQAMTEGRKQKMNASVNKELLTILLGAGAMLACNR